MRLLLDQGLPRSRVHHLDAAGVESAHVGEKGLATARDAKIIDFARQGGWRETEGLRFGPQGEWQDLGNDVAEFWPLGTIVISSYM